MIPAPVSGNTSPIVRIALDARIIASSQSGIARYTLGLLKGWGRTFPEDEWVFATHREINMTDLGLSPEIRRIIIRFPDATLLRPVWEQAFLPSAIRRLSPPPEVFFSPLGAVLSDEAVPSVATIHDVAFLRFPRILPARYRVYWRITVQRAVQHAARIISVSQSTANDLTGMLGVDEERIRVIHEGVDDAILVEPSTDALQKVRKKYKLPERFLLFVGTLEPRKDVDFLLDVHESMPPPKSPLVLAGDWGWLSQHLRARIAEMREPPVLLGSVPMEDLGCIYRLADMLVFPSLYEGFGLPLVEAMAVGLPVVAVTSSSIPEVVGDAAWLVEPGDTEGFAQAIQTFLTSPEQRAEYSKRARERSKLFSWEEAAIATRAVFDELLTRTE